MARCSRYVDRWDRVGRVTVVENESGIGISLESHGAKLTYRGLIFDLVILDIVPEAESGCEGLQQTVLDDRPAGFYKFGSFPGLVIGENHRILSCFYTTRPSRRGGDQVYMR